MLKRFALIALSSSLVIPAIARADDPRSGGNTGTQSGNIGRTDDTPANNPSNNPAGAKSKLGAADQAFVLDAASGGMLEVKLGNLAQQKGQSDTVRMVGKHMVADHTQANAELLQVAQSKGVMPVKDLNEADAAKWAQYQKLSGADFDRFYLTDMVQDHKKDIASFDKEASDGQDADVKAFAAKTLPTLREHLKMVEQGVALVAPDASVDNGAQPAASKQTPDGLRPNDNPNPATERPTNQGRTQTPVNSGPTK